MMTQLSWVHLSDLHLYMNETSWNIDRVLGALERDIKELQDKLNCDPDFLFFTGDLVRGQLGSKSGDRIADQFDIAATRVEAMRKWFRRPIPVSRTFFVPGNHDVNRDLTASAGFTWLDEQARLGDRGKNTVNLTVERCDQNWQLFQSRFGPYKEFLTKHGYAHCLSDPHRCLFATSLTIRGERVGIAGINSAWSAGHPNAGDQGDRGRLWLGGDTQLGLVWNSVNKARLRILLMHHPASWLTMTEHNEVERRISDSYHFFLHGHEHDQGVVFVDGRHFRIDAGALYTKPQHLDGYNFVQVDTATGACQIWRRRYSDEGDGRWGANVTHETDDAGCISRTCTIEPVAGRRIVRRTKSRTSSVKPRAQTRARKPAATTDHQWTSLRFTVGGYIVVSDISGFTALDPVAQETLMSNLWKIHASHNLVKSSQFQTEVAPHGDGIVVVLPENGAKIRPKHIYQFARALMRAMTLDDIPRIRIGIHFGAFGVYRHVSTPKRVVIGTGVNECLRIAGFGDAGHIMCSERFVQAWVTSDVLEPKEFTPTLDNPPTDVYGKQNADLGVRLMHSDGIQPDLPARFRLMDVATVRVMDTLKGIETMLREGLQAVHRGKSLSEAELGARVSILAPRIIAGEVFLCSTPCRYFHNGSHAKPGLSRYGLEGAGIGPPGQAYVSRKCVVVRDLPIWSAEKRDAYVQALQKFGVTREMTERWQRHSRSLLSFPFGLFDFDSDARAKPDGVICIDADHPLTEYLDEEVVRILEEIQRETRVILPTSWKLRELA